MICALALTGPTASGKTALSIALARELRGEIISCDSMQIYKEMDIGTAKATEEERKQVPHHLVDFLSPDVPYSADNYRSDAVRVAGEIADRGKLPIFVGGTGLYIDTVARAPAIDVPPSDPDYRERVLAGIKTDEDIEALWQRLYAVDPASAEKTHKNNVKRVVRALEIYDATGKTKTYFDTLTRSAVSPIKINMITLDFHHREKLYERIDKRVDKMLAEGLLEEARSLYERGFLSLDTTAGQAIGYKELLGYIEGKKSLSEATEEIKLASRRYAKRQLTWFRHSDAYRLFVDTEDGELCTERELIEELLSAARSFGL
ncbi:MAG: tRNA (adenosine(37)-N6)-dimethylallyltransferase MiaA [Clostridia bacterium]|nr:tRNA (adenosine(37)-N6)-dimethylallyltransferase MiaA [Clostridia bacterium]